MFSKLKKLVAKDEEKQPGRPNGVDDVSSNQPFPDARGSQGTIPGSGHIPQHTGSHVSAGMRSMEPQLQRKFGRGVHYNMKILIRGERNVGKTCLLNRLQGGHFSEEYKPSEEIQIANISWNFKTTDDVVKVEVWDVVDKGKKKRVLEGLKLQNTPTSPHAPGGGIEGEVGLDAETLDVYKGAHGVILMMDFTKVWTYEYVRREMEQVPPRLPVLILLNFRDLMAGPQNNHTSVTLAQVQGFVHHLERPKGAAPILVAESSMRNGFGLKYLHKFLNLPYLQLQRETVLRQVEQNRRDMECTFKELESLSESEEQNYDRFLCTMTNKTWVPKKEDSAVPAKAPEGRRASATFNGASSRPVSQASEASHALPTISPKQLSPVTLTAPSTGKVKNVDDFVPDDTLSGEFLDDTPTTAHPPALRQPASYDSSDEEVEGNPMVATFQDEVDLEDTSDVQMALSSAARNQPPPVVSAPQYVPQRAPDEMERHDTPPSEVFCIDDEEVEDEQTPTPSQAPSLSVDLSPTPLLSPGQPETTPSTEPMVKFSAEELSSWLGDLETRDSVKKEEVIVSPVETSEPVQPQVSVDLPVKKKKKSKKKEGEKSSKPKAKKNGMGVTAAPVVRTEVRSPAQPTRKASQPDEESMARELEDFLASEDD